MERTNRFRIVIKIGSSSVTNKESSLNNDVISDIAGQARLLRDYHYQEVAIVSSGAVAAGRALFADRRREELVDKQMLAAYGQPLLIGGWIQALASCGARGAQFLLTGNDLNGAKQPLEAALKEGIPIINANDPVNDREMRQYLMAADNDRLAGFVAQTINANRLVLLTDVDGVHNLHGEVIREITSRNDWDRVAKSHSWGSSDMQIGTGGMQSKLEVAWEAAKQGRTVWIANAKEEDIILKIVRDELVGTKIYKP